MPIIHFYTVVSEKKPLKWSRGDVIHTEGLTVSDLYDVAVRGVFGMTHGEVLPLFFYYHYT